MLLMIIARHKLLQQLCSVAMFYAENCASIAESFHTNNCVLCWGKGGGGVLWYGSGRARAEGLEGLQLGGRGRGAVVVWKRELCCGIAKGVVLRCVRREETLFYGKVERERERGNCCAV